MRATVSHIICIGSGNCGRVHNDNNYYCPPAAYCNIIIVNDVSVNHVTRAGIPVHIMYNNVYSTR